MTTSAKAMWGGALSAKAMWGGALGGIFAFLAQLNWLAFLGGAIAIVGGLVNIYATWQRHKREKAKDDRDKLEHEAKMDDMKYRAPFRSGDIPNGAEQYINES